MARPRICLALAVTFLLAAALGPAGAQGDRFLRLDEATERHVEDAVAYVTVVYQKTDSTEVSTDTGSAFFVNSTILITNHHVIASALEARMARIEVRVFSGTPRSVVLPAELLKSDELADLALLRIRGPLTGGQVLRLSPEPPARQTELYAFGFPLGAMLDKSAQGPNVSLRRGYVSRLLDDGKYVEADLNIDKGVSGGPMVDAQGMVRAVVRSIAGSEFNRMYAGIGIAAATVVEFCRANGCRVTLADGLVVEPGAPLPAPVRLAAQPSQRPRRELGDLALRAFFAIGAELRLNTMVPSALILEGASYSADILQTSKSNISSLAGNLTRIEAPGELRAQAQELGRLLDRADVQPGQAADRAKELESAFDQWVRGADDEERVNYQLGAWLAEISADYIRADTDVPAAEEFVKAARAGNASPEVAQLLECLLAGLRQLVSDNSDDTRRAVRRGADRLMAIGYLAGAGGGLGPDAKPTPGAPPLSPPAGRNRINLHIP